MPLLHHAVLRVAEIADEVIVVLAPDGAEPAMPQGVAVRFAHDGSPAQGPLAGLVAGLSASEAELAFVAGGDMPELSPAVARAMLRAAEAPAVDAVVLHDGEGVRPLPLVLRVAPGLQSAGALLRDGERRLRALPRSLRTVVLDRGSWQSLDPRARTLRDVDTPADLVEG